MTLFSLCFHSEKMTEDHEKQLKWAEGAPDEMRAVLRLLDKAQYAQGSKAESLLQDAMNRLRALMNRYPYVWDDSKPMHSSHANPYGDRYLKK